jgi:hypothetical protein
MEGRLRPPSFAERLVRHYVAGMVGRLSSGLLLLILIPVVVAIAIVIFVVLGVVLFGLFRLLGEPGILASGVGIVWFVGSLLALFLVLRRGRRWLTRLIDVANAPASIIDPFADLGPAVGVPSTALRAAPDLTAFRERLAAADARLAVPATSGGDSVSIVTDAPSGARVVEPGPGPAAPRAEPPTVARP